MITTSSDQTTRVFCKSTTNNNFFEVSRPQIHGYDINTISLLNQPPLHNLSENVIKPPLLISGGDEKVIRVFDSPYSFVKSVNSLSLGK